MAENANTDNTDMSKSLYRVKGSWFYWHDILMPVIGVLFDPMPVALLCSNRKEDDGKRSHKIFVYIYIYVHTHLFQMQSEMKKMQGRKFKLTLSLYEAGSIAYITVKRLIPGT